MVKRMQRSFSSVEWGRSTLVSAPRGGAGPLQFQLRGVGQIRPGLRPRGGARRRRKGFGAVAARRSTVHRIDRACASGPSRASPVQRAGEAPPTSPPLRLGLGAASACKFTAAPASYRPAPRRGEARGDSSAPAPAPAPGQPVGSGGASTAGGAAPTCISNATRWRHATAATAATARGCRRAVGTPGDGSAAFSLTPPRLPRPPRTPLSGILDSRMDFLDWAYGGIVSTCRSVSG